MTSDAVDLLKSKEISFNFIDVCVYNSVFG